MKSLLMVILTLFSGLLFSSDIDVTVEPKHPLVGEPFRLIITVPVVGNDEPYISFDPGKAEVLSKDNRGVSINTTVINGRVTTKKEISYEYEMSAERAGNIRISNIKVEMGGKTVRLNDVNVTVVTEPVKSKPLFALAVISKKQVFVGEALDVDYYIYSKVPVTAYEIESFPKLNKAIKRVYTLKDNIETVNYNGEVYRRSVKFAARIFPEKDGKLIIDPIKFKVQYTEGVANPYSAFGLVLGQQRVRSVLSEKIEVEVLPLPSENLPPNFTGLVGHHEFKLDVSKTKFLANEPIEAKLEVTGPGALETYEGPKLYDHQNLEKFDTKSELVEIDRNSHKKIYNYTYLGRGAVKVPSSTIELSYFDPEEKVYKTKKINLPGIEVSGATAAQSPSAPQVEDTAAKSALTKETQKEKPLLKLMPIAKVTPQSFKKPAWGIFVFALLLSAYYLARGIYVQIKSAPSTKSKEADHLIKKMKKNGITYSDFFKLVTLLRAEGSIQSNPLKILQERNLKKEQLDYFENLILKLEEIEFKKSGSGKESLVFNAKYFNSLLDLVE